MWTGNKDPGDTGPSRPFSQDPANAPWPGCPALGTAEPVRQGGRLSPSPVSGARVLGEVPGSQRPPTPVNMKCFGVHGSGGGWAAPGVTVGTWLASDGGTSMVAGLRHGRPPSSAWPGSQWTADARRGCGLEQGSHLRQEPSRPRGQGPGWRTECAVGSVGPPLCRRASRRGRGATVRARPAPSSSRGHLGSVF